MKKVVLIGDSIRKGYQPFVFEELGEIVELWSPEDNCGPSGKVLEHIHEWVIDQQPDILHINCGLHDLRKEYDSPTPSCEISQYKRNIKEIFQMTLQLTQAQIIWATTTPVNQQWHHERKGFDRFEADVIAYNRAAFDIVNEIDMPVNDLYTFVMEMGRDTVLLKDGVHYPVEASQKLGKKVADTIRIYL